MTVLPSPIPHPLSYSPWDLPGWIYEALDWVVGMEWPEGDERAVWDLADKWYAVAASLAGPQTDASTAAGEVHQGYGGVGAVAAAFGDAWRRVADGEQTPLPVLLAVSHDLGRVVEECGCDIEAAKLEVWIELGILVVELLALAVAAVLTAGAASPAAAGVIAATRFLVQQIFRRLLAQLARKSLKPGLKEVGERAAKQVTTSGARSLTRHLAKEGATEAAQEAGINLATQAYQQSTGRRHELNVSDLGADALGGLAGGAAAPLAGLGRHATGRGARMVEHLGREMTGEVIADQAASLATGQGLTSLEDAARAAVSGARGSVTGQADHALQARLDGQLAALSGSPLLPPVMPGPTTPGVPQGGGASMPPSPVTEGMIPAQRPPTEPFFTGPTDSTTLAGTPASPSSAGDLGSLSSAGTSGSLLSAGTPGSLSSAGEGGSGRVEAVDSRQGSPDRLVAGGEPPNPVDLDAATNRLTETAEHPQLAPPSREASVGERHRSAEEAGPAAADVRPVAGSGGPAVEPGPALSTVGPQSVVSMPAPAVLTGLEGAGTGGTPVSTGPVSQSVTTGSLPAASVSTATGPAVGPVPGTPTVARPETGPALGVPGRAEPPPGPPRSTLVDALAPASRATDPAERATPPTRPPGPDDRGPDRFAAEREALERRRYQGYFEAQRAHHEEARRSREVTRLRGAAAEHYRRAGEYAAHARQLYRSGHRELSDGWQRAANAEARAYGRCLDLADAVASGAVVPDVVDVERPEDFHRINDDVGELASGAIGTGDRSVLTGDDDHPPPIDRSRRYGQPGGLRPPLALHQLDVEQRVPRDEAGKVVRTPDPRVGGWFGLMNDGGPRADPTRGINCLDCTLSLYDTWVHGRPRVSAPRTFDAYQAGDVTRPLHGEQDGTGRVEDVTGGRFQRLCDGTATTPAELQRALDAGYRNLRDQLVLGGHGSFAFVVNHLEQGGSHIWVAVNQNGTVLYLDPQVGLVSDQPLYRHHGAAYPFNAIDADVLVLDGGARPMPLAGLRRGIYSQRPDLPAYPPAEEFQGYGEPYLNRVHLLGESS
ncbi:toxin glutamine deamidase domain-containing protein [Micromonospora sp. NPDC047134]|uniref:toxin glutamine deamidase domain-containing protein n=1 Tax=Micromonospora sp. NPDC047134 TaxID=3154340 RepID=UPI0033F990BE